jgi:hypothetical protein
MSVWNVIVSGAAGIVGACLGAVIGAKATRKTSLAVFERQVKRETEREQTTWRKALHEECKLNLLFDRDREAGGLWAFDTRVLRECFLHTTAFNATELQRILFARTDNAALDTAVEGITAQVRSGMATFDASNTVATLREKALGEIRELEKLMRKSPLPD